MFLHVDINSYFATMLQQKYPKLRGKPVAVVKSSYRQLAIAVSKEAKELGIKTGDFVSEARKLAPNLIVVPAEFSLYLDATKRLKKIFTSLSPHVEIFSLDEAFIDITACEKYLYQNPIALGRHVQILIREELGDFVTCNVGVAKNRFLAKLASEVSPKGSVVLVDATNQDEFLATAPFASVCGVGLRLEKRLAKFGITNLYQLNFVSDEDLYKEFGPFWSKELRHMSQGEEPAFLGRPENEAMKSVSRSQSFLKPLSKESDIQSFIYNLTREVVYKCRKMHLVPRQFSLSVTNKDAYWSNFVTLSKPLTQTQAIFNLLYHNLYTKKPYFLPAQKIIVRLSLLSPKAQLPLFVADQKQECVEEALDTLSGRYGLYIVTSALLLGQNIVQPEVTGFFGDKKYYGV
jgi:DNA polymerase-4